MDNEKNRIRKQLEQATGEVEELGGWESFKSGEWLWRLIQKSFRNYWERGTAEYFREKYGTTDPERLVPKLISVAARNASLLGGATGAAMSANELVGIATGGEGLVGIPANIALALGAVCAEAVLLMRIQLQLVANVGKAYGVPLDPDDPEDVLTILAFAFGGAAAQAAGEFGMKVGGKVAGTMAKGVFRKEVLAFSKRLAARVGIKLLQRNIVKYTVPVASMLIGLGWNYASTRSVGWLAVKHFKERLKEMPAGGGGAGQDGPGPDAAPPGGGNGRTEGAAEGVGVTAWEAIPGAGPPRRPAQEPRPEETCTAGETPPREALPQEGPGWRAQEPRPPEARAEGAAS